MGVTLQMNDTVLYLPSTMNKELKPSEQVFVVEEFNSLSWKIELDMLSCSESLWPSLQGAAT